MMSENSNYPMGVNGSHDYFNQPDPPSEPYCPNDECMEPIEHSWWNYCPNCGQEIGWGKWDELRGDWQCS